MNVDNDDAFALIDETHPIRNSAVPGTGALKHLLAAHRAWFRPTLAEVYRPVYQAAVVVPNALDPRVWRDYRAGPTVRHERTLRMVYMGQQLTMPISR